VQDAVEQNPLRGERVFLLSFQKFSDLFTGPLDIASQTLDGLAANQ
jgi:hypothetical protein